MKTTILENKLTLDVIESLKTIKPTREEQVFLRNYLLSVYNMGAISKSLFNTCMIFTNKLSLGDLLMMRIFKPILIDYWTKKFSKH